VFAYASQVRVGDKVAVIGAGGIGFDVSEYLLQEAKTKIPIEERLNDVQGYVDIHTKQYLHYI
jgi:Zn-dependent alcohol dehydrogenase